MPPLTKLEHSHARETRQRRMVAYAWLGGAVLLWGLFGVTCVSQSVTCAQTAPAVHRLALVLTMAFGGA
eukprot:1810771-Prymnesium_polylepis.1